MKTKSILFILILVVFYSCSDKKKQEIEGEINAIENNLLPAIQIKDEPVKKYTIAERMEHYKVPGISIAVVKDGELHWAKGYGIANTNDSSEVTTNTLFQAGSISKPIAAFAALKLVEEGKIDLDEDVNTYLKDWKIPDNKFTETEKVTLRRLLTHTAGMTVHGFPGYQQKDTFPSIKTVLNGKGNTTAIVVDTFPGSIWRYSGGGFTVMEKLVEDVSGLPLEKYMAKNILPQMGMLNSTYEQPLPETLYSKASAAYNGKGEIIEGLWHNYPEQAAAGLWTTPSDLANYCLNVQNLLSGKEKGVLSKEIIEKMLTKHKNDWGLGVSLQGVGDSLIFSHGGKNEGFTNNLISFAHHGDAVIIMTNADNGGALINEILRSISSYYGLEISNQKVIEVIKIPVDQLNKLTGKYKLNFQIPGIGDYFIEMRIKDSSLTVNDLITKQVSKLYPLQELKFIDIESGEEVQFQKSGDSDKIGLIWNNQYPFSKID
ncbi:MAG TPA: serine hydrolase [Bacteroidales bacterium]|nr:serine hydrolase [Bacteroidales bacterium]